MSNVHEHSPEDRHDHDHDHEEHGGHDHHHDHGANLESATRDQKRAFAIGVVLNLAFCIGEAFVGYFSNSMALIADAGHNFTDVIGLALAWVALLASTWRGGGRFTYGLKRSSIIAAFINGSLLMVSCVFLVWECVARFFHPEPVRTLPLIITALLGIVVNGYTAWLFMKGSKDDINVRGAFLHLAADAAVSLGVALSGVVIYYTRLNWIDSLVSLLIVGVIIQTTWSLLTESLMQLVDAVPRHIDIEKVRAFLLKIPGVSQLHDLHVWNIGTNLTALSAHVGSKDVLLTINSIHEATHELRDTYKIAHPTIQVEPDDSGCEQKDCGPNS
ncbi:MAG: cation diffusion facilitator family transporter [Chthoniobacterales bacterium]